MMISWVALVARRLRLDSRGTGATELALVAPLVGMLLMGSIDAAMGFSARLRLEQAAQRSIEMVTAAGRVGTSYDYVRVEASNASGQPLSAVTVDAWLECDGVRAETMSSLCAEGETVARYVSVRIVGSYEPRFARGPIARAFGGDGNGIPIAGDAAVRVQ